MRTTSKSVPPRSGSTLDFLSLLTGWMQQGIESFTATQQIFGEVVMRQNVETSRVFRQSMSRTEHSPRGVLTDLAIQGTSSFVEAQRILLNLAQRENDILMNGATERLEGSAQAVAMTELARRSLDTLLRMQHDFLASTGKQTLLWLDTFKNGTNPPTTHLVDLAKEGMEHFVRAQKKFLDVIEEEISKATEQRQRTRRGRKTELSQLAREAANSFIDAQKLLLDVVNHQVNINLKAATRTMGLMSTTPILPLANVAGEGIKEFVGAEKALIESIVTKRKGAKAVKNGEHRQKPGAPPKVHRVRVAQAGV